MICITYQYCILNIKKCNVLSQHLLLFVPPPPTKKKTNLKGGEGGVASDFQHRNEAEKYSEYNIALFVNMNTILNVRINTINNKHYMQLYNVN